MVTMCIASQTKSHTHTHNSNMTHKVSNSCNTLLNKTTAQFCKQISQEKTYPSTDIVIIFLNRAQKLTFLMRTVTFLTMFKITKDKSQAPGRSNLLLCLC